MKISMEQEVCWSCYHCGFTITDQKKAWSRHGEHWCCRTCMEQDIVQVRQHRAVLTAMSKELSRRSSNKGKY